jgi:hypothetical protein
VTDAQVLASVGGDVLGRLAGGVAGRMCPHVESGGAGCAADGHLVWHGD